jgi:hypothetical protein
MRKFIVPLGWIGFTLVSVFYGRPLWDHYIEGKSSAAYLPRAAQESSASPVPVYDEVAELEAKLRAQGRRVSKLEQLENMSKDVSRIAANSVGLIVGEYIWTDAAGHRPLRYAGVDAAGNYLRDKDGQEAVAFDGEGPLVVRNFKEQDFRCIPVIY